MRDEELYVLIPTLNEEEALPSVLQNLTSWGFAPSQICIADNGSTDRTREIASQLGCLVSLEPEKGYGATCLKGMALLRSRLRPRDILIFLDGDGSDDLGDLSSLLLPIQSGEVDFTLGSRMLGGAERGSLSPVQRFGNFLTSFLLRLFFQTKASDLGPFRAIRWATLESLEMQDRNFGWTVEMQIKIAKRKIPFQEIPVRYHKRRLGKSKVSGTISGSAKAGFIILFWVFREWNFGRN